MGARALLLLSSLQYSCFPPSSFGFSNSSTALRASRSSTSSTRLGVVRAMEEERKNKQSLLGSITEALDFSQVRSSEDAVLIEGAREATQTGRRMTREQYGALRRKIGGTYKDFFKSYIDVDGQYVEEGWVDKTCKVCKKDTRGEPRQVDNLGRYVHVSCLDKSKSSNFFSKLFSR